ncbi:amidohydrolase [Evansella caseinilytica]|uniref:Amidohydrolase n=1 Tax=Evansella caseinilytica TaxID=1503961 RepID=A0A1H3H1R5_9BACI|nr:amidohydrolase [Evansella caseinilytica]SDY08858.1 amidohydrolase [Evansella caseinilytica]
MSTISFKNKGRLVYDKVVELRRKFHQYPELSHEETETSRRIQEVLRGEGISFQTGFAGTGVLGIIRGNRPGKTIALRADMDALPIQEQNTHEFVSEIHNKMHACGHDAHVAMLLGAGMLLNKYKEQFSGTILLVFQPAEEDAPVGGAQQMIADGVFADYRPDAVFAQHVWPDLPVGKIGVCAGPMMGNSDRLTITIKGASGHASMPHQTVDAIIVANQVISSLQTIISRNVDPFAAAVLTIGKIAGGTRYNVIAESVTIEGTVRTYSQKVKKEMKKKIHDLVRGIAGSMGAAAEVAYVDGYPATVNDEHSAALVKATAVQLFGTEAAPDVSPSLGGEDFGRFLLHYPGAYYWLGTALSSRPIQKPLHDPQFEIDEKALEIGVEVMAQLGVNALADRQ